MAKFENVKIIKTCGAYCAAATAAPYFCFFAPSKSAVIAKVEAALEFWTKQKPATELTGTGS